MSKQSDVEKALLAGSLLIDAQSGKDDKPKGSLKGTLLRRLGRYYDQQLIPHTLDETASVDEIQLVTAEESLHTILRVQALIQASEEEDQTSSSTNPDVPLIGTRDIGQLRTLLGITFKWGTEYLLPRVLAVIPDSAARIGPSQILSVESAARDFTRLSLILAELLKLLFPNGPDSRFPQTLITTTLLNKHLTDILRPAIALGWLPRAMSIDVIRPLDDMRPLILRLLSFLPPSQNIIALGEVISSSPSPPYIRRSAGGLLARQVLRPQGVRGLCEAVFGEDEDIDAAGEGNDLDKIEQVGKVLTAVPKEMDPKGYHQAVIPKLIDLLTPSNLAVGKVPAPYKRAAAFTISRMLQADAARPIILSTFQDPFRLLPPATPNLAPARCLVALTVLLTNTDPSPILISTLLTPIVPALYSLQQHLEQVKASDPMSLESVRGLLQTWARVVEATECVGVLWSIVVAGEQDKWLTDLEGNISHVSKTSAPEQPRLALFTPKSLREAEEGGELDPDANLMELYPDPARFVATLHRISRSDVVGELFVRCLEAYRAQRRATDPLKTLLYLQLVMQMQTQLEGGLLGLKDPAHVLEFVKHALEDADAKRKPAVTPEKVKTGLDTLKIVDDDESDGEGDGDSDDDMPDSERHEEMTETAVTLLLSILEANPSLSSRTAPILEEIFDLLDVAPPSLNSLVREARMVMTARWASSSTAGSEQKPKDDTMETYQRALKLLQDPILPVRAHGLLLLRELKKPPEALVPAILDIFMEAIKDDESYIYLNGVQGLAALVEKHGKEILKRLASEYSKDLDGLWDQAMVDKRVRIGEALGIVIKRCGQALGAYVDFVVPRLMAVLRSSGPPTALKTSSVSLLGDCVGTHLVALGPYWDELVNAMLDLLQVETTREDEEDAAKSMDANPTKRGKFPPLRRAALHFLGLLVRETTRALYDGMASLALEVAAVRRAKLTLAYLAATDGDGVVRIMAREVNDALDQLEHAYVQYGGGT